MLIIYTHILLTVCVKNNFCEDCGELYFKRSYDRFCNCYYFVIFLFVFLEIYYRINIYIIKYNNTNTVPNTLNISVVPES